MKNKTLKLTIFFIAMIFISSCVSKKKYYTALNEKDRLNDINQKLMSELSQNQILINSLQRNLTDKNLKFDKTVNRIIKTANNNSLQMAGQYQTIMSEEIKLSNNILKRTLGLMFPELIKARYIALNNDDRSVEIVLNTDSLFNSDKLQFETKAIDFLKKLSSKQFKNIIKDYSITAKNEITYLENNTTRLETIASPSVIYDRFNFLADSLGIAINADEGEAYFPDDVKIVNKKITLNLFKNFKDLPNYTIDEIAKDGEVQTIDCDRDGIADSTMVGATAYEMSIIYSPNPNSTKYLVYPADYLTMGFDRLSDHDLLKKLNSGNFIKLIGNEKRQIGCHRTKSIIVTENGHILRKYSKREITCTDQFILN